MWDTAGQDLSPGVQASHNRDSEQGCTVESKHKDEEDTLRAWVACQRRSQSLVS